MTNLTRCRSHESIQRGVRAFLASWNSNNRAPLVLFFVLSYVRWHVLYHRIADHRKNGRA